MKKPLWIMLMALFAVSVSPHAKSAVVEKVVAVVNDSIVTLSELNEEIREITTAPAVQVDVQEVLDAMVDRILLDQQAAARKISVSDEE
ncbi:MAG: hypothetical protein OXC97_05395, partial [Candidatus Dadabacteria bacterium]|nr:hypothetical protein [Candidatus Dadabacteria bacterium]